MTHGPRQGVDDRTSFQTGVLVIFAVISTCLYAVIALLSWRFDYHSVRTERPIIAVLVLFAALFLVYLKAIRFAWRAPQSRYLLRLIIGTAVVFRAIMLFSVPIQEIDIYRYLWDGAVSTTGVSPFVYSPQQVLEADPNSTADVDLAALVKLRSGDPALAEILGRVHYGELPTVYPPTSQVVFAAATLTGPPDSPVLVRVFIMKAWLVVFDLATLFVVIGLLKLCRKPVGLCVIYAWCPLLIKEVANSGHLDSVAVFLTTLAVFLSARLILRQTGNSRAWFLTTLATTAMAVVLALAVGAKLYPIVLAPLIFLVLARKIGWRHVPIPAAVFAVTTLIVLWPMLPDDTDEVKSPTAVTARNASALPESLPSPNAASAGDPSRGVRTYLGTWEMNDFIFLLLVENLKPTAELPPNQIAWFSIAPEPTRKFLIERIATWCGIEPREAAFLTARAITALAFILLAVWFAVRAARTADLIPFCGAAFLTLAWFWLLAPTQYPWYWTWALPLLPFARGRAWLAVSGLVLLYYLRFWLSYHWPNTSVSGTGYAGHVFFDFVVTWIEFAPWFVWLAIAWELRAKTCRI